MQNDRRSFLKYGGMAALGMGLLGLNSCGTSGDKADEKKPSAEKATTPTKTETSGVLFPLSLAQWSLHKTIRGGQLDHLDFASMAKNDFGIDAVEYVNQFFKKRARDKPYIQEMKKRADDNGVKSLLIMIDGEGPLAHPDNNVRGKAIQNHYQWVEAAYALGCHSIRVNLEGEGSPQDMAGAALDGLATLSDFAKDFNMNVIVENHGGPSSDGQWLSKIIGQVRMPNCGTLPDFGNFCITKKDNVCVEEYDRYQGMQELLPYAKAISAKAYDFDAAGNETTIDFQRIMEMLKASAYRGYIGIEYEGEKLSEVEGIRATKKLLDKVIASL